MSGLLGVAACPLAAACLGEPHNLVFLLLRCSCCCVCLRVFLLPQTDPHHITMAAPFATGEGPSEGQYPSDFHMIAKKWEVTDKVRSCCIATLRLHALPTRNQLWNRHHSHHGMTATCVHVFAAVANCLQAGKEGFDGVCMYGLLTVSSGGTAGSSCASMHVRPHGWRSAHTLS